MNFDLNTVGLAALLWAAAAFLAIYGVLAPIRRATNITTNRDSRAEAAFAADISRTDKPESGFFTNIVRPALRNFLPQAPMARAVGNKRERILHLLISAGNPWRLTPEEYLGLIWLGGLTGGAVGVLLGIAFDVDPYIAAAAAAAAGAWIPRWWYTRQRSLRIDAADKGMPEGIDLLRIVMASGQRFGPAMKTVSDRLPDGIIKDEFTRISNDLRAGMSVSTALGDFVMRVPAPSVEAFVLAMVQGERLGADTIETLERQADTIRRAYENKLDKAIATMETTIYLPILIGLMPAAFLILLAPALSSLMSFL